MEYFMSYKNFIFASLCDNDFGISLLKGLPDIAVNSQMQETVLTEEDFKYFLVHYVLFEMIVRYPCAYRKREWKDIENTRDYLNKNLKVLFLDECPTVDHDGGSAIYDINLRYAWLT
jgi:hypothetical protein